MPIRAERIEPPPALVAREHGGSAQVQPEARGIHDQLGERRDVAQRQVPALPGDRMDRARGVADQHEAAIGVASGLHHRQRIVPAGAGQLERAVAVAEPVRELQGELVVVERDQLAREPVVRGPDDRRAPPGHRQHRERPGRRRSARRRGRGAAWRGRRSRRCRSARSPSAGRRCRRCRAAARRGRRRRRAERRHGAAARERERDAFALALDPDRPVRRGDLERSAGELAGAMQQGAPERAVLDDVAERLVADVFDGRSAPRAGSGARRPRCRGSAGHRLRDDAIPRSPRAGSGSFAAIAVTRPSNGGAVVSSSARCSISRTRSPAPATAPASARPVMPPPVTIRSKREALGHLCTTSGNLPRPSYKPMLPRSPAGSSRRASLRIALLSEEHGAPISYPEQAFLTRHARGARSTLWPWRNRRTSTLRMPASCRNALRRPDPRRDADRYRL